MAIMRAAELMASGARRRGDVSPQGQDLGGYRAGLVYVGRPRRGTQSSFSEVGPPIRLFATKKNAKWLKFSKTDPF